MSVQHAFFSEIQYYVFVGKNQHAFIDYWNICHSIAQNWSCKQFVMQNWSCKQLWCNVCLRIIWWCTNVCTYACTYSTCLKLRISGENIVLAVTWLTGPPGPPAAPFVPCGPAWLAADATSSTAIVAHMGHLFFLAAVGNPALRHTPLVYHPWCCVNSDVQCHIEGIFQASG